MLWLPQSCVMRCVNPQLSAGPNERGRVKSERAVLVIAFS
jgi:hypothetical protein